jgi:hypothetical protein
MEDLIARMRDVIESQTDTHRRFKELEERTGLKSTAWQNFFNGRQRPTWEMIELVAKTWPQYAFWLTTGIDDTEHGHQKVSRYHPSETRAATEYFLAKLAAKDAGDRFEAAMRRAHLVQETSGNMAGHARYEFAPGDELAFATNIRASENERSCFLLREQEDQGKVSATVSRYQSLGPMKDPESTNVYAPTKT